MRYHKTKKTAILTMALLVAASFVAMPGSMAGHENGHTEIQEGPLRVELERLDAFQNVTATPVSATSDPDRIGEIAFVTITIEDATGPENTTFTAASFSFGDACDTWVNIPAVRECSKVPGTVQQVTGEDPSLEEDPQFICIHNQRITIDIGPFQPFFSTGELKEPVQGPCP